MYACQGILSLAGVDAETKYGIGDDDLYVYCNIAGKMLYAFFVCHVGWLCAILWIRSRMNAKLLHDTFASIDSVVLCVFCTHGNVSRECEHIWIWILMVIELEWWRSTLLPLINGNVDLQDSLSEIVKNGVCFFFYSFAKAHEWGTCVCVCVPTI